MLQLYLQLLAQQNESQTSEGVTRGGEANTSVGSANSDSTQTLGSTSTTLQQTLATNAILQQVWLSIYNYTYTCMCVWLTTYIYWRNSKLESNHHSKYPGQNPDIYVYIYIYIYVYIYIYMYMCYI